MNQNDRHIKKLLDRWIKGSLNRKTEADLEGIAREDAFTGEALKGFRKHASHDHEATMMRLRKQVGAKKGNVRPLSPLLRIAASICLLAAAGFAFWLIQQETSSADLAQQTPKQEKNIAAEKTNEPREEITITEAAESAERHSRENEEDVMESTAQMEPQDDFIADARRADKSVAREQADTDVYVYNTEPELDDTKSKKEIGGSFNTELSEELLAKDADIVEVPVSEPTVILPEVEARTSPAPAATQDRARDYMVTQNAGTAVARPGGRMVKGFVKDNEGYPLIGATIHEQGTVNGAVSDVDGFFQFAIAETQTSVLVSAVGYTTQEVTVEGDGEIEVILEESMMALDEVVVSGYGSDYDESDFEEAAATNTRARPSVGVRDYNTYVTEQTALVTATGKIRLTFDVQADGSVTNIQVKRSNNEALNDYAIKIISDGPNWEIVSGVAPVSTSYTVRFR